MSVSYAWLSRHEEKNKFATRQCVAYLTDYHKNLPQHLQALTIF